MTDADKRAEAARVIAGYGKCMTSKLRTVGRGEQNAEMMLVSRVGGELKIDDLGGWADRNASCTRMLRELDASGALPDFAPLVLQTGDRCIARNAATAGGPAELHLWQQQPLSDDVRAKLPLDRVLSMCGTPRYADVAVPDWCFDAWPEAGVPVGGFDAACAALAAAGAASPTDGGLGWRGTAHHHPSRMRLVELAREHPAQLRGVVAVADRTTEAVPAAPAAPADESGHAYLARHGVEGAIAEAVTTVLKAKPADPLRAIGELLAGGDGAAARKTLLEQVASSAYLLDIQGKGYSSRLKLLLHSGRPVFLVARPWVEYYMAGLDAWVHYVPVAENLSDLLERVAWAVSHPEKADAIGRAGQAFAQEHLTRAQALRALGAAIATGAAAPTDGDGATEGDELRKGDWASNRKAYDAVKMYYRWTFMPVSKDRRRVLGLIASKGATEYAHRDLYTFGVYTGASLKFWLEQFSALKTSHGPMWGFDSFEGLPEETEGMALECNAWLPGSFSAADQFGEYSFAGVKGKIEAYLGEEHAAKMRWVKGFFSDSLTPTLKSESGMKPALMIDVDVDLYVSAYQCMDWMLANGLMVGRGADGEIGTVVYYDDVSIIKWEGGELKAHAELTEKYAIEWDRLHDSCWEVVKVGGLKG